jgi:hypothetical protein
MVSVRRFCQEPGYPITLLLTYSFDPLFFERISLADLQIGGSRRIVIAADLEQVSDAMSRCIGQVAYLGRHYVLAETAIPNTFHPKLIARLSREGGKVWIGSGNLTQRGWGGNRELATTWSVGPGHQDSGTWLNDLFDAVNTLTRSSEFAAQVEFIRSATPWLTARTSALQQHNVLLGMPNRALAPQLAERWKGRRFNRLMLCTGSTDTDGAFLSWAHRIFGVTQATICLSPAFVSFESAALSRLPFDIRIVKAEPNQLMHAKFYWFSGPEGDAAIIGSANCSAAAWLAGRGVGNIELVAVYDSAQSADFKSVLEIFDAKTFTPAEALPTSPLVVHETETQKLPIYRLINLRLRAAGRIEALIEPRLDAVEEADLILSGASGTVRIKLTAHTDRLIGRIPADFELGSMTAFAHAELSSAGTRYVTNPRWLDNEAALDRASRTEAPDPNLRDLSRKNLFSTDQQKVMEAVYAVSTQLLGQHGEENPALQSVKGVSTPANASEAHDSKEQVARPVDPAAIVRSLKELSLKRRTKDRKQSSVYTGSLESVIAQLFSHDEDEEIDLSQESWTEETQTDEPEDQEHDKRSEQPGIPPTSAETYIRFRDQIELFLRELGQSRFAETCVAKRMVQALAFPLLLCVRGTEAGWLPLHITSSVAVRLVHIMFNHSYGRDIPQGLFRRVQSRYTALGKEEEFLRAVGNGTLWAALIASLATAGVATFRHVVRYASALSHVFECKELLAVSDAEQLSALVPGLIIKDAEYSLTIRAPIIANAMTSLRESLVDLWETINREQKGGRDYQVAGSVMWSPTWGWKVLPASPAQTICYGYINVETAAAKHVAIQKSIDALVAATISTHANDSPSSSGSNDQAFSIEATPRAA